MQNHYLASYLRSLKAVLTTQFTSKGGKGGKGGVAKLAEESLTVQVRVHCLCMLFQEGSGVFGRPGGETLPACG